MESAEAGLTKKQDLNLLVKSSAEQLKAWLHDYTMGFEFTVCSWVSESLFTLLMTQDSSDLSRKFFGLVPNPSYPHLGSVKSPQCLLYDVCVCILGDVSQGLCLPLICLL